MYTLSGDALTEKKAFQAGKEVVVADFSPDGATLAIASARCILLFDSASYEVWLWEGIFHSSSPLSLSFPTENQGVSLPHG